MYGLVKTYTAKLNRENAQKAREKINRNRMFVNMMQFTEDDKRHRKNNIEHFYRKATKETKQKSKSKVYSSIVQPSATNYAKVDPSLRYLLNEECHTMSKQLTIDE